MRKLRDALVAKYEAGRPAVRRRQDPGFFREAVNFTAAETTFAPSTT